MKKMSLLITLFLVLSSFFLSVVNCEVYASIVVNPAVSAGDDHTIVLRNDGTVWTWGKNNFGQLGDGTDVARNTPMQVLGLSNVTTIDAGANYNIISKSDGTVWTWGDNYHGQLGNGTTEMQSTPVQVIDLNNIIKVTGGLAHSLALESDGTVWAWGHNNIGQLGDGTGKNSSIPVQVLGLTDVVDIAAGGMHSLALKSDGTVWAWGFNNYGQLGNGTTTLSTSPVQVSILSNITAISAGSHHSMALGDDGTAWTWGYNSDGQIGNNSHTNQHLPVQQTDLNNIRVIAAGNKHSFAIKEDGTVWAWGQNNYGKLGDGSNIKRLSPVQVIELTDIAVVAGGGSHSVALKSDGTLWTWGANFDGQLGDSTTIGQYSPIQVETLDLGEPLLIPNSPTILETLATDKSITVIWSEDLKATAYDLEIDGVITDVGLNATYTHINLLPSTSHTYRVRAKNNAGVSQWSELVTVTTLAPLTTQLDIEAEKYDIPSNTTFTVDVVIRSAEGIYAQDITVQYDTNLFEFVGGTVADPVSLSIYHGDITTPGKLRYIIASNGESYDINGDSQVLTLTFKAKQTSGEGLIQVISGLIADGYGSEIVPEVLGKTFRVFMADVNGDGMFRLSDLGIAARLLRTTASAWESFTPDIDGSGIVEEIDLQKIVEEILREEQMQ